MRCSNRVKQASRSGETGKKRVTDVGKSEWPLSDDGQDNITCFEPGAILRPRLVCELNCGTVDRINGKDSVRVYGDPG